MNVVNGFVQALVWATMVGFLYVLWLNYQGTSPIRQFEQALNLRRVLRSLQTVWMVIGLSLLVSVLLLSLPHLAQAASAATPSCAGTISSRDITLPYAYHSISAVCRTIQPIPSGTYPASEESGSASPVALPSHPGS